jgi:hypothetical protein
VNEILAAQLGHYQNRLCDEWRSGGFNSVPDQDAKDRKNPPNLSTAEFADGRAGDDLSSEAVLGRVDIRRI